ncbi:N-acetylglucosaminidase [Clostridium frigidicarnis]|uniref:Beta-N-acetylglucosaminidase n=1 Tax=Clostridium frigidicarnis TaxID=84698 RepID=A0A1I1B598_9CLOT|nr:glucosaminidase domain-containing protein [Clostridium frigidicarnis]SFB45525.1 Beta-N-acetylglucosaminidase [Clostridium frigidicarnis]
MIPKMWVETPIDGSEVDSDEIQIIGWALDSSGIKRVNIYLNDKFVGYGNIGIERTDLYKAFPEYKDSIKGGFSYKFHPLNLKNGWNQLKIEAVGNSGSSQIVYRNIRIRRFPFEILTSKEHNNTLDYYTNIEMKSNTKQVIYDSNIKNGSKWRVANLEEIKYYMNPSNFLNDHINKLMFMKLSYSIDFEIETLNFMLQNRGILNGKGEYFLEAGKEFKVNPVYLICKAILETGNGGSDIINGKITVSKLYKRKSAIDSENNVIYIEDFEKNVPSKKVYNVYGIGSYDDNPNLWGADRAYRERWFTIEDAIVGGAKWIADGYINIGQDTLYNMRWDFKHDTMWHQYSTDVAWASKQTSRLYNIIQGNKGIKLVYEIPLFK